MPKDRDQMTPTEPEDRSRLAGHRGQGSAGTGHDLLPSEADESPDRGPDAPADDAGEPRGEL